MNFSVSLSPFLIALALLCVWFVGATPAFAQAGACTFTRTLSMGDTGEDVLCLQKYLNTTNHKVAGAGVGSPGKETTSYGSLTETAVLAWQKANGVAGANGNFGPASQAKYRELTSKMTGTPTDANGLLGLISTLQAELDAKRGTTPTPQVAGVSTESKKETAERWLSDIMNVLVDTEEQIEDVDEDEQAELADDLADVRADFFDLLKSYFADDYDEIISEAKDVLDDALEVFEDAGGETDKDKAEEKIEDVEDLIEEVEDLIEEAQGKKESTGDAKKLLKKAQGFYQAALKAFSNRLYRQAHSDAFDAEELLEDALGEIDFVSVDDAEKYVEKVRSKYNSAKDDIDEAKDDGEDVEDAVTMLKEARRELKRADIAVDEESWSSAIKSAGKAEKLIKDALKAIGGSSSADGDSQDAKESLDDAWDRYRELKRDVDDADDDGDDMRDAYKLLKKVKSLLNEAGDAFDDEDWDEVLDIVDEIEDLLDDVEDEL